VIADAAELLFGAGYLCGKMCVRAVLQPRQRPLCCARQWPVAVVATSGTLGRQEGLGCADVFEAPGGWTLSYSLDSRRLGCASSASWKSTLGGATGEIGQLDMEEQMAVTTLHLALCEHMVAPVFHQRGLGWVRAF